MGTVDETGTGRQPTPIEKALAMDEAWLETPDGQVAIAGNKDLADLRDRCGIRPGDEAHRQAVVAMFDDFLGDNPGLSAAQINALDWTVAIREDRFGRAAYWAGRQAGLDAGARLGRTLDHAQLGQLNPRQLDILASIAEGKTYKQIGADQGRTAEAVRYHVDEAAKKLGMKTLELTRLVKSGRKRERV